LQSTWISVDKKLPKVGTWCNVLYDRNKGDYFDRLNKLRFSVYGAKLRSIDIEGNPDWCLWELPSGSPIGSLNLVTHWTPLPTVS